MRSGSSRKRIDIISLGATSKGSPIRRAFFVSSMFLANFVDEMANYPGSSMIWADFVDEFAVFPGSSTILPDIVDEKSGIFTIFALWQIITDISKAGSISYWG